MNLIFSFNGLGHFQVLAHFILIWLKLLTVEVFKVWHDPSVILPTYLNETLLNPELTLTVEVFKVWHDPSVILPPYLPTYLPTSFTYVNETLLNPELTFQIVEIPHIFA